MASGTPSGENGAPSFTLRAFFSSWKRQSNYSYDSLSSDTSFRIMKLHPGRSRDPVKIQMQNADFNSPPSYEAISYAWGDPSLVVKCECDGRNLLITRSLHQGLKHLRLEREPRYLWADGVCINQGDQQELGHQVNNMKRVYENSSRTLIWLGPDSKGRSEIALEAIRRIGTYILEKSNISKDKLRDVHEWRRIVIRFRGDQHLLRCTAEEVRAIKWLYEHEWFRRLWVLQEFNSSPNAKTICGYFSADSMLIAIVANWIYDLYYHDNPQWKMDKTNVNAAAQMLWDEVRHPETDFLLAVHFGLRYKVSDPRDRVYALLGMSDPSHPILPLTADYTLSTAEVYKATIKASIEVTRSLKALSFVIPDPDNLHGGPSWMPTWSYPNRKAKSIIWHRDGLWDTCSHRKPACPGKFIGEALVVEGLIVDEIQTSVKLNSHRYGYVLPVNPSKKKSDLYNEWLKLLQPTVQYGTHLQLMTAYAMTLTCGFTLGDIKISDHDRLERFDAFLSDVCGFACPLVDLSYSLSTEDNRFKRVGKWTEFALNTKTYHSERHILTSVKGYIGQGRHDTKPGDKVAIIWGAQVPFLLRPHPQGGFVLVGEAYMHGLMEGEGMQKWENGEFPGVHEQKIEIR